MKIKSAIWQEKARASKAKRMWAKITLFLTLLSCLYFMVSPLVRFFIAQNQARKMLQQEVMLLKAKLPSPHAENLIEKMPLDLDDDIWRQGFKYYPERHAYKYTFLRRIKSNYYHHKPLPEPLERRSVWFQAAGDEWKCYAGVKNRVRGDVCQDVEIIRGLKEKEHEQALYYRDVCAFALHKFKQKIDLPADTVIVSLDYRQEKEENNAMIKAYLSEKLLYHHANVLLVLDTAHDDNLKQKNFPDWQFFYEKNINMVGVITQDTGAAALHGLPENTPVFTQNDFPQCTGSLDYRIRNDFDLDMVQYSKNHSSQYKSELFGDIPTNIDWQSAPTVWQNGKFSDSLNEKASTL